MKKINDRCRCLLLNEGEGIVVFRETRKKLRRGVKKPADRGRKTFFATWPEVAEDWKELERGREGKNHEEKDLESKKKRLDDPLYSKASKGEGD